jgi:hypothetical protein
MTTRFILASALLWLSFWASSAQAIDVVAMYRGSCQIDTGVVLRVDNKSVVYLGIDGTVKKVPRYEIVGVASYPLPGLPVKDVTVPPGMDVPLFHFETFRGGDVVTLARGWPIDYNTEHVQVLTMAGDDHLVVRDSIWSVKAEDVPKALTFKKNKLAASYKLRHPLPFERCADNITPGEGAPVPVIPQLTYDNPIAIKRYHDALRDGYAKIGDYADRQAFYAVPQVYLNRTLLGTWGLIGSRYANVGARQVNFLPLVQDEYSEGPFGFQRVVRSGVAPLAWGLHEEPTVQVFYGLKADYIHVDVFFDPTSPLIGPRYNYSKGQLDDLDDRLVEKGGLEFGFDFGHFSLFTAFTSGNIGIRANDTFEDAAFSSSRSGLSAQYNYYKVGFYAGSDYFHISDDVQLNLRFLKIFATTPISSRLTLKSQLISRQLADASSSSDAPFAYESDSQTIACEADWDLNYRWTVYLLGSLERRAADVKFADGATDDADGLHPKLASGVTVMF